MVEAAHHLVQGLDLLRCQAQAVADLTALPAHEPHCRVDMGGQDALGGLGRHLLDVHAAIGGGHDDHPLVLAIHQGAQVELTVAGGGLLDQELADGQPGGAGLAGHQPTTQQAGGLALHGVEAIRHHHATGLATSAGMDLGLDHPLLAAEFLRQGPRLADGGEGQAPWHRDTVAREQAFRLVFV